MLRAEWGADLIASWNKHDWIALPQRVGAKLARLLGAEADEVIACDSTTVNLFKVMSAALALHKERTVVITGAPAGLLARCQPDIIFSTFTFAPFIITRAVVFNSSKSSKSRAMNTRGGH